MRIAIGWIGNLFALFGSIFGWRFLIHPLFRQRFRWLGSWYLLTER